MAAPLEPNYSTALAEGTLKKTGDAYGIHTLLPQHLPQVTALQASVLAQLGAERFFLVPKTRAQFFGFLQQWPLACMYGLVIDQQLAAQIILRLQVKPAEHARNITAINDLHQYALVQGAITHPARRGLGLMPLLLDFLTHRVLPSLPVDLLLARVVPENTASLGLFLKAGYKIVAAEPDPDDERRVFYLGYNFAPKLGETRLVDGRDYESCQQLCRSGWHGVAHHADTGLLTFQR